jgi:hypothetical protein
MYQPCHIPQISNACSILVNDFVFSLVSLACSMTQLELLLVQHATLGEEFAHACTRERAGARARVRAQAMEEDF